MTKKEALEIVFKGTPVICMRFDKRRALVKDILRLFTLDELKEIERKKRDRSSRGYNTLFSPILDIKQQITMYKRDDNYRKILIEGRANIYWVHPIYLHSDYNKCVFSANTPENRKRMYLINKLLNK